MIEVTIAEHETEDAVAVFAENHYDCRKDDITGDWAVYSSDDPLVQQEWLMTKSDAIKYALEKAGVIEDANYQRSPDRTSA